MNNYLKLRKEAIDKLKSSDNFSSYDEKKQIEDLRIYQIELELQNEELNKSRQIIEISQKYFTDLFQHSPIAYIILSLEGNILDSNLMASKYLGYNKETLINQRFQSYIPQESIIEYNKCISEIFKVRKDVSSELLFIGKDGKRFWCKVTIKLINHPDQGQQILCSLLDISNEKKANNALQESNRKFNQAVEQSPVCIMITDTNLKIEYVNPRFYEITGYSKEEIIGKTPKILKSGIHPKSFYSEMWNEIKNKNRWNGEICNKKKNGELFWESVTISSVKNKQDIISNYIAVKEDITQKKEMDLYIQNQFHFLQELINTIPLPVFYFDSFGVFKGFNRCFKNYTGLSDNLLQKSKICDVLFRYNVDKNNQLDLKKINALEYGIVYNYEIVFKHNDETLRNINLKLARYQNAQDKTPITIGAMLDITEHKKLQHDLEETIEKVNLYAKKANEASLAKTQFLANMSHEIRTPMNSIIGMLDILLTTTKLSIEQKDYIKTAHESANNLLTIINDILDISKIEVKQMELINSHFDLNQLIQSLYKIMLVQANQKGIKLHLDIDSEVDRCFYGDSTRVRQILINIVGNAIKFTEKGHVSIKLTQDSPDKLNSKCCLNFVISDTGSGIESDKLDIIFESFKQADGSMGRYYGGTGLGLAISKRLCELMDGSIEVESISGKGSKFTIKIMLEKSDLSKINNETSFESPKKINNNSSPKRILIVDDMAANIKVAAILLQHSGYITYSAKSGFDAIEFLKTQSVDIVLMDVEMPGLNGFQTTQLIRNGHAGIQNKDIKIIALTAHAVEGFKENCLNASMNGYISKPFKSEDLINVINECEIDSYNNQNKKPINPIIDFDEIFLDFEVDKAFITDLMKQTKDDLTSLFSKLENAYHQNDTKDIVLYSHSIKGLGYNIGSKILSESALKLEEKAKNNITDNIQHDFMNLKNSVNEVFKAIEELI